MSRLADAVRKLDQALGWLSAAVTLLSGLSLVFLVVSFGWLVYGRYVLNETPTWVEQVALLLPHLEGRHVLADRRAGQKNLFDALDDDEVVEPDYLEIALQSYENPEIPGAAGFYEDGVGSIFLPEPEVSGTSCQEIGNCCRAENARETEPVRAQIGQWNVEHEHA